MSRMVFAITGRGKIKGRPSTKIQVGSWAIGYWRPKLCFELNVWDCFVRRVRKLARALKKPGFYKPCSLSNQVSDVLYNQAAGALYCGDALMALEQVPANSVDLILTDPPHSDRVPYLELSEMWNAILGCTADFEKEIVVSNAKDRRKGLTEYNRAMGKFLSLSERVLKNDCCMVMLFNARGASSWEYLDTLDAKSSLEYRGHFPLSYSAGSVVQDSRRGSLKHDLALVFQKTGADPTDSNQLYKLQGIEGWSNALPGKQEKL
jgi:adenine-specific DNA methylase